jgi:hypothetical protein
MRDLYSTNVEAAAYLARSEAIPEREDRPSLAELAEDEREWKAWLAERRANRG